MKSRIHFGEFASINSTVILKLGEESIPPGMKQVRLNIVYVSRPVCTLCYVCSISVQKS